MSETEVLDQLLSHRKGKTTILISHRPRVINRVDWIIFLEEGQVKLQVSPEVLRSKAIIVCSLLFVIREFRLFLVFYEV